MSKVEALVKRHAAEMALMPPPPTKRTKRPSTVLDEEDYTDALAEIIARDYFPGLAEAKAQEEYLTALESKNDVWIREASRRLKDAGVPHTITKTRRTTRDSRFDTPRSLTSRIPVSDTPRGPPAAGSETPMSATETEPSDEVATKPPIDRTNMSLSSFQAKYTSEDNESFNTLLDKQNNVRRKKHAYLWTDDQRIPSQRLLTHRAAQSQLLETKTTHEALANKYNEQALVPLTTGATASRPASVDSWHQKSPANTFMFHPTGIEENNPTLPTVQETRESLSKAGPKETVFANTRFSPHSLLSNNDDDDDDKGRGSIPASPSLNTTIIARRDARRAAGTTTATTTTSDLPGSTPRVAGYAFVDEDDDDQDQPPPPATLHLSAATPNATPNPFRLSELRRREDLHLRLVARDQAMKREKTAERTPVRGGDGGGGGNMTPAARRLMERLGGTMAGGGSGAVRDEGEAGSEAAMWTPARTPRRKR